MSFARFEAYVGTGILAEGALIGMRLLKEPQLTLAVSKGPQSRVRYCWWYRSSHSTDLGTSSIATLVFFFGWCLRPI